MSRPYLVRAAALATASIAIAAGQAGSQPVSSADLLYVKRCATCHGRAAQGSPGIYPPLRRSAEIAQSADGRLYLAAAISVGLTGEISVDGARYRGVMPGLRNSMSPKERVEVLNFVIDLGRSANRARPFTLAELAELERQFPKSPSQVAQMRARLPAK